MLTLPTIPHTFLQGSDKNCCLCNTGGNPELPRNRRCLNLQELPPKDQEKGNLLLKQIFVGGMTDMPLQFTPFSCHPRTVNSIAGQTKGEMIKGSRTTITFLDIIEHLSIRKQMQIQMTKQNKLQGGNIKETLSRALLLNVVRKRYN